MQVLGERMAPLSKKLERIGPLCALAACVLFLVFFGTAMALDPTWRIGEMWLSDLGVRQAAWAFNTGCVLAGFLILPFAVSLRGLLHRGVMTWIGIVLLFVAGLFLIGIGVFTEYYEPHHFIVSVGFFAFLILAWLALAYPMQKTPAFGGFGAIYNIVPVAISGITAVAFRAETLEAVVVLTAVGWGLVGGATLLLRRPVASEAPSPSRGS